jgi:hypothetical protein
MLAVVEAASCTTRLYPGPKRPDIEVATIEADGMTIVAVDEQRAPSGVGPSRYDVAAGMHSVSVRLNDDHPVFAGSAAGGHRTSDNALAVCFLARGKHTYLVRPAYSGRLWQPEIIDENVTGVIVTKPTSAIAPDCSPEAPRVVASAPPVAAREAVPSPAASDAAAAAPDAGGGTTGVDAGAVAPADEEPAAAQTVVKPAVDTETPRAPRRRMTYEREAPPARRPLPPAHPGTGVGLELGLAFGGDELATVELNNGEQQTLGAGDGLFVAIVGNLTPIWVADAIGLGLGASVGWKYGDVGASNGSFSLSRFPVSAFLQVIPRLNERWFLLARGGVTQDLGATFSGSGVAATPDVTFDSRVGGFGDLGAYRAFASGSGLLFVLRYTNEKLGLQDQTVDASSVGFAFGVYFGSP